MIRRGKWAPFANHAKHRLNHSAFFCFKLNTSRLRAASSKFLTSIAPWLNQQRFFPISRRSLDARTDRELITVINKLFRKRGSEESSRKNEIQNQKSLSVLNFKDPAFATFSTKKKESSKWFSKFYAKLKNQKTFCSPQKKFWFCFRMEKSIIILQSIIASNRLNEYSQVDQYH